MSSHEQQSHSEPLAAIDGNARQQQTGSLDPLSESNGKSAPAFSSESQQHQSLHGKLLKQQQYVRPQAMEARLRLTSHRSGQQAGAYVSPSDNIMSPASSKLNAFKQNRFNKYDSKINSQNPTLTLCQSCQAKVPLLQDVAVFNTG